MNSVGPRLGHHVLIIHMHALLIQFYSAYVLLYTSFVIITLSGWALIFIILSFFHVFQIMYWSGYGLEEGRNCEIKTA